MNKKNFTKQIERKITFSCWSRKGFAVFASLKSVVKIGFLSGTISILATPTQGYSQTDTIQIGNHLDIDEVVVSTNRTQVTYNEVSRMVTVVPAHEIQNTSAQSLNELLKLIPGVDIRSRGGQGVQSDVSLRGGSFEQTLILLNGVPVNDPQTGHHNLNLPVNLDNIERIEILHGAGARVYGPNAFTGAINIITNTSSENRIKVLLSGGQYGLYDLNTSAQVSTGVINHYISGGAKGSDGYTDNTDFKTKKIFYRANANTEAGNFGLQAGYLNKAFGAQDFYTLDYPDQFEEIRQLSAATTYNKNFSKLSLSLKAHYKQNHDRFELFREDKYKYVNGIHIANDADTAKFVPGVYQSWNYYAKHNYHLTKVGGFDVGATFSSNLGETALGIDYRIEEIHSNVLGNAIDTIDAPGETRGFFSKKATRKHFNMYIEQSKQFGQFDLSAGVLLHNNNDYGSGIYGGVEMSYLLGNSYRLFGSVNQAMRMPTYTDLYYSGPRNFGNVDLKPEELISYELGIKQSVPFFNWQLALYHRNVTNAIDWIKYPSDIKYTTTNFSELNSQGVDASLLMYPASFNSNLNFVKYFMASYSFANVNAVKQDSAISAYSLDYLKHKATIGADISLFKNFGAKLSFSVNDRNGNYENVLDEIIDYKPYTIFDLRLYYSKSIYNVFVDVNNVFNTEFVDVGGVVQSGIWVKAGIKIDLKM